MATPSAHLTGRPVPGVWTAALGRAWMALVGWRVEGGCPDVARAVIVAAHHTSNWDLPHMLAASWVLGVRLSWVAKHTLFRIPVWSAFLRCLGGVPVDRRAPTGFVREAAARIREAPALWLAVPPSGTRSRAAQWKSGFYWIAREAQVPLVLGALDYRRRRAFLSDPIELTGDPTVDMERIRAFYAEVEGRYPDQQTPVRLKEEAAAP